MKFSDIHENLTEAPEKFNAKQGLVKQAKTKIKKKLSPTKKGREQAQVEDDTKQAAKQIKSQYNKWMAKTGGAGAKASTASFIEFASQHAPELAPHIEGVANKLNLQAPTTPEEEPEQTVTPDDSADQQVEPNANGDQEDLISPEAMVGDEEREKGDPTKKPAGMEQEEYDSIKAAYAKKAEDQEESVEEDSDDAEPKIDMSASIYEARLNSFLLFEREMKDNELDTLIVRVIQAAAKGDNSFAKPVERRVTPGSKDEANRDALIQRVISDPKAKLKGDKLISSNGDSISLKSAGLSKEDVQKDGWRQKVSRALTGTGNVGDLVGGNSDDSSGSEAPNLGADDVQALAKLLSTVAKGKAGANEKAAAAKLLKTVQNTYGE